jgi:hypothetical protein
MKAYIVRVLEVEEIHGFFYYTQEDTGDRHGPFVDVPEYWCICIVAYFRRYCFSSAQDTTSPAYRGAFSYRRTCPRFVNNGSTTKGILRLLRNSMRDGDN